MFPNLIELEFHSSFPVKDNLATPPAPLSWIQSLTLELPKLPLHYVEYLTPGLPNCLENLRIKLTDTCFDKWAQDIGDNRALQFARKSSQVDRFKLVIGRRGEIGRRVQQQPQEARITFFYTFVNNFIGDREVRNCRSELNGHRQEK